MTGRERRAIPSVGLGDRTLLLGRTSALTDILTPALGDVCPDRRGIFSFPVTLSVGLRDTTPDGVTVLFVWLKSYN